MSNWGWQCPSFLLESRIPWWESQRHPCNGLLGPVTDFFPPPVWAQRCNLRADRHGFLLIWRFGVGVQRLGDLVTRLSCPKPAKISLQVSSPSLPSWDLLLKQLWWMVYVALLFRQKIGFLSICSCWLGCGDSSSHSLLSSWSYTALGQRADPLQDALLQWGGCWPDGNHFLQRGEQDGLWDS